jgi:xylulose-5-phosphate/fructose-6-phosphate phosphoketolase
MDVIERVESLQNKGGYYKDVLKNMQIEALEYAYNHGVDKEE